MKGGDKMNTPNGYDEMVETFRDIRPYINEDGTLHSIWEEITLGLIVLPFPMLLSWNKQPVTEMRCNHLLTDIFQNVFKQILQEKLEDQCQYFGGCYMYRAQRRSKKISTHAWGIAIDLDPDTNQMGTPGSMNQRIIEIFESFGFIWGGGFNDPMHFQFVKGY